MSTATIPGFLAHRHGDSVAVATMDLAPGDVEGTYLNSPEWETVRLAEAIPLGHKFALAEIAEGEDVVEYGTAVGVATEPIPAGAHVHVHNIRSIRWNRSVAS